ncbi:MAG: thermonuclease family protein [Hyphomonadaceae bacterium]|nr:thermonuclease family protein [Hyphomonadaceae bacterium]
MVLSLVGLAVIWVQDASRSASASVRQTAGAWASSYIVDINWVDGDSGTINGREFRLHGVDAPEGSPSKARCREERERAAQSRAAVRRMTRDSRIAVSTFHGADRYGRELVDLTVNGADLATLLAAKGHVKYWNFENRQPKPDWCGLSD